METLEERERAKMPSADDDDKRLTLCGHAQLAVGSKQALEGEPGIQQGG